MNEFEQILMWILLGHMMRSAVKNCYQSYLKPYTITTRKVFLDTLLKDNLFFMKFHEKRLDGNYNVVVYSSAAVDSWSSSI